MPRRTRRTMPSPCRRRHRLLPSIRTRRDWKRGLAQIRKAACSRKRGASVWFQLDRAMTAEAAVDGTHRATAICGAITATAASGTGSVGAVRVVVASQDATCEASDPLCDGGCESVHVVNGVCPEYDSGTICPRKPMSTSTNTRERETSPRPKDSAMALMRPTIHAINRDCQREARAEAAGAASLSSSARRAAVDEDGLPLFAAIHRAADVSGGRRHGDMLTRPDGERDDRAISVWLNGGLPTVAGVVARE